ncbi:DUF998 domain-containing protein [Pseudoalteromonas luteoviolacea]|uniref:DUF998 domain-containing protein n=1 Tax=Pseudoalteromonas luteoviolacea TaxID=43657 RepID=UPI001B366BD8|nr:DUF998 domain-containing protein [Pseudoalteromonas luteoviolacea]MBQ4838033.1 DUF998 domain-containing protein [Pseudoalteromonas luteoviolacea]
MEGNILLLAGLLATIWITLGVYVAGRFYPNYNHKTQFCSELGAAGSPTEKLSPLINNYPLGVLFCVFGWAVTQVASDTLSLTFVGWLIVIHGVGTWVAGFFPMDKDPYTDSPTLSCQIHSHAGFIMLLSLLVAPIIVAFSDVAIEFRVFSGLSASAAFFYLYKMSRAYKLRHNLGLYQRISYWIKLVWLAALSVLLWQAT